jgi:peptidyl-prolyl cis-trans isomerase D
MLQKIGDSLKGKKTLAYLILVPLALVFAVWGAVGIVNIDFTGAQSYAARVNGSKIPLARVSDAWREQQSEWQQRFGTEIPEATRTALQNSLLEQFVRSQLLSDRSRDYGYRVSAQRIEDYIRNEPAFQVDGKYNDNLALARLTQLGVTPEKFKADLRDSMQNAEIQQGIAVSEFMTPAELGRLLALEDEQREVRYAVLPAEKFQAGVQIDDAAVAAAYKKDEASFMTPETVRLQYAELRLDQVASQVVVADSDLQDLYAKGRDRYVDAEKRRARHILITIDGGNDAAAAKLAADVLAQAKAGGDFEALAKKYSKDAGSAAQGGDLGWSERNAFVGPFADAVFSMKEGELRGPIKTQFGYHVIRLDGVQAGRTKSYDEAKVQLEAEFRRDRAADLFGERQEQVQRKLEEPKADFAAIAREFGLQVGEVAEFARGTGGAPLGADRGLDEVVFGDATLNQRRVGGPVPLGEDRFVIVKVLDHHKPAPKPLATVRDQIVAGLRKERGTEAARAAAEAATRRLEAGDSFEQLAKSIGATAEAARFIGRGDPSIPAQIREFVFSAPRPRAGKPVYRAIALEQGGAAIVAVTQSRAAPPDSNAELRATRVRDAVGRSSRGIAGAYVSEIRRGADVETNTKAFQ